MDRQFGGQLRDEVDLDDGGLVARQRGAHVDVRVDVVARNICLHLGARQGDADAALVVVERVVGKPSRAWHGSVHEIIAVHAVARDRSRLSRRSAGLARDNWGLLAGAGHWEGRGFDGQQVVLKHALAIARVQHPRVSVEAGGLSQAIPGRVGRCRTRCAMAMACQLRSRRLTVFAICCSCWDRSPPVHKALDASLERHGGAAQHPLEVAVMRVFWDRSVKGGVFHLAAETVTLAPLERQVLVVRIVAGCQKRRLRAIPPGKRDAHTSEARRRRIQGGQLILRRRLHRETRRSAGKHGFLGGSPVVHLYDSAGARVHGGRSVECSRCLRVQQHGGASRGGKPHGRNL